MAHSVVRCDATNMVAIGPRADIERPWVLDGPVAIDPKMGYKSRHDAGIAAASLTNK